MDMKADPATILHLITSLEKGGAQGLLIEIASSENTKSKQHIIVSLKPLNTYTKITTLRGIKVLHLNVKFLGIFHTVRSLIKIINEYEPTIIQSWMYHADFLTILIKPFIGKVKLVWSFHHGDPKHNKNMSFFIAKVCSKFSSCIPQRIIACSEITKDQHIKFGYDKEKIIVINNGVDTKKFKYKPKIYTNERAPVVGFIGRWHTIKGHEVFIKAASLVQKHFKDSEFIMIGTMLDTKNIELKQMLKKYNIYEKTKLIGEEDTDIIRYYKMMDIYVCSSWSESFSLTLVEAALQGIPIVSTDVGIASEIVENKSLLSNVGDFKSLARSILTVLNSSEEKLNEQIYFSHAVAKQKFALDRMISEYEEMYNSLS